MLDICSASGLHMSDIERNILELRVNQNVDWAAVINELGLSGKAEAIKLLRQAVSHLVDKCQMEK